MTDSRSTNPHCPYCGTVMVFDGHMAVQSQMTRAEYAGYRGHYMCPECLAQSPEVFEANKLLAVGIAAVKANQRYKGDATT